MIGAVVILIILVLVIFVIIFEKRYKRKAQSESLNEIPKDKSTKKDDSKKQDKTVSPGHVSDKSSKPKSIKSNKKSLEDRIKDDFRRDGPRIKW